MIKQMFKKYYAMLRNIMLIISVFDLNNVIIIIHFKYFLLLTDCGEIIFVNNFYVVFTFFF